MRYVSGFSRGGTTWTGDLKCTEGKNWLFPKEINANPVLPGLSLAGNLEKLLMSLYGTEWSERGYGLRFPANGCLRRTGLHLWYLFRQNPVFTSLHLKSPIHVVPPQITRGYGTGCQSSHRRGLNLIPQGLRCSWKGVTYCSTVPEKDTTNHCYESKIRFMLHPSHLHRESDILYLVLLQVNEIRKTEGTSWTIKRIYVQNTQ